MRDSLDSVFGFDAADLRFFSIADDMRDSRDMLDSLHARKVARSVKRERDAQRKRLD